MDGPFAKLLLALVIAWLLQGVLSFCQATRFYGKVQQLRRFGRTAVGVSGNIYKTKAYGVLVADAQGRIVHAEKLTGLTIFAQPKPVDLLVGHMLDDVLAGPIEGLSPKLQNAFRMAAEAILKETDKKDKASTEADVETDATASSGVSVGEHPVDIQ